MMAMMAMAPQVIKGEVPWQYLTALHWSLTQFTPAGRLVQWSDYGVITRWKMGT
jgi:hypothetical protein